MDGLVIEHLSKSLGGRVVVDDLSLRVAPGDLVCLLGPSGCGKTTTLRMIGGFLESDSGTIAINGKDVTTVPPERRPTAMVFQNYALWPHMTVFKNVSYGLRLRKLAKDVIEERVVAMLRLVNLAEKRDRHPSQLSGGEQQRVALARALVLEPDLLLLDEPLSNLDAKLRVGVREEIREIQQRLGIATVFVTHDQDEALTISDRIAVMSGGRIEQYDDADGLYRLPRTSFVASFIGVMSTMPGRVADGGFLLGASTTVVACPPLASSPGIEAGVEWSVGVRPEDVRVQAGGEPTASVVKEIPHGHFKEIVLRLDGADSTTLRAYVGSEMASTGRVSVSFARALLYRDGHLVHEVAASAPVEPAVGVARAGVVQ